MCSRQTTRTSTLPADLCPAVAAPQRIRIELVDNWHRQWPDVLAAVEAAGQRQSIAIDEDGWLSARQVLLVAFIDAGVAGHLCFRIAPTMAESGLTVEAHLDAFGVVGGEDRDEIECLLRQAATEHARTLRCDRLVGILN